MPTREQYEAAFEKERHNEYPVIDALEARLGFAVDRARLEDAARVLACPVKKNPPNWQHGRVIYALARSYLARGDSLFWLDVGSAKGFSAVCMAWAINDSGVPNPPHIWSVDVIDPDSNEPRNSIFDGKAKYGIYDYMEPFEPPNVAFVFSQVGDDSHEALLAVERIGFAFIDGSHTYDGVKADIATVTPRQQAGDIIMFDDLQVAGIVQAVSELDGYDMEYIDLLPKRKYAIGVKR